MGVLQKTDPFATKRHRNRCVLQRNMERISSVMCSTSSMLPNYRLLFFLVLCRSLPAGQGTRRCRLVPDHIGSTVFFGVVAAWLQATCLELSTETLCIYMYMSYSHLSPQSSEASINFSHSTLEVAKAC